MKLLPLFLCLIFLPQQNTSNQTVTTADDPTVSVILARKDCVEDRNYPGTCTDVTIMKLSEAQKKYDELAAKGAKEKLTADEERLYAALVIGIGSLPSEPVDLSCLSPQEKERIRWHRLPAQAQNPCEGRKPLPKGDN